MVATMIVNMREIKRLMRRQSTRDRFPRIAREIAHIATSQVKAARSARAAYRCDSGDRLSDANGRHRGELRLNRSPTNRGSRLLSAANVRFIPFPDGTPTRPTPMDKKNAKAGGTGVSKTVIERSEDRDSIYRGINAVPQDHLKPFSDCGLSTKVNR
jgi:hypothetical protein